MKTKFYIDPSIWRDYYENRSDRFRPLGEWALKLINEIIENKNVIIYSDFVIEELKIKYNEEEINKILGIIGQRGLLLKVDISKAQLQEASILCKKRNVAFGDALHAILARDNKAIMITRDKHFLELLDIVEIKKPEDLI
ncbi:MAG: PIN domain-containing protein [Nanoarchaeota archaeon]